MSSLTRTCLRLLEPRPELSVAIAVEDAELASALAEAVPTSGATLAVGEDAVGAMVLSAGAPDPLVASETQAAIERVAPGGTVVVVLPDPDADTSVEVLAARLGPNFDLAGPHGERVGGMVVVRGRRRGPLPRADIKRLRGIGHGLEPNVLVGRPGLTAEIVRAARAAVERHGIIKAKLTPQCALEKGQAARDLAWATGAQLVQRIGKTAVLYRPDVKLDPPTPQKGRKKGR